MCTAIKWEESDAANCREEEVKVHQHEEEDGEDADGDAELPGVKYEAGL